MAFDALGLKGATWHSLGRVKSVTTICQPFSSNGELALFRREVARATYPFYSNCFNHSSLHRDRGLKPTRCPTRSAISGFDAAPSHGNENRRAALLLLDARNALCPLDLSIHHRRAHGLKGANLKTLSP